MLIRILYLTIAHYTIRWECAIKIQTIFTAARPSANLQPSSLFPPFPPKNPLHPLQVLIIKHLTRYKTSFEPATTPNMALLLFILSLHVVEDLEPLQRPLVALGQRHGLILCFDNATHDFPTCFMRQLRYFRDYFRSAHFGRIHRQ